MNQLLPRRQFLTTICAGAGAAMLAGRLTRAEGASRFKKAVNLGMVQGKMPVMDKFKLVKELGYDGVELNGPNGFDKDEVVKALEATGLGISEVVDSVHWIHTLSHPSPDERAKGVEGLKGALQDAKAVGATTVLLVAGRVNKNVAYDDAYKRSQEEIRKVIPFAQEQGVKIAIENVWNDFLLSPLEMARYIDEFNSEWVGVHFDVGNVGKTGWPEQWIRILGKRILKLHVKEYSRAKGFGLKLGDPEGECDWPAVVKALTEINYTGWATAEVAGGDREVLKDIFARMNKCLG